VKEEVQLGVPDDSILEVGEERPVPCGFRTGRAGTGKSFWVMEQMTEDPEFAQVCATTGIAAVNLGAVTINSTLRYFDTLSMRDSFLQGHLTRILHKIAKRKKWFLVEEASMLEEPQLDYLYRALGEANRYQDIKRPMGLMLVGDFAQLPPVKGAWAFTAACWGQFAQNTIRMEKVWRQDEGPFLDALNHARMGDGGACAEVLTQAGIQWHSSRVVEFDGTTILCKNEMVSRHNAEVLKSVRGETFKLKSERWGVQRSEWGENRRTHEWGIPPQQEMKLGAYIMILSNSRDFSMVNGDCGYIREWNPDDQVLRIELVRTQKLVDVRPIVRSVEQEERPQDWQGESFGGEDEAGEPEWHPRPHYKRSSERYVVGQIRYLPVRLAYASTCHKIQGLSLDRVQVDLRDRFFSEPAMTYVSLSRCRTLEGLRIVCDKDSFVNRVQMDKRVRDYL
jgi:ATP-dependent DNA helicase PIF1